MKILKLFDENILIDLVNALRPSDPHDTEEIQQKIQSFIDSLLLTPTASALLQSFLLRLINQYKQVSLYADSGILSLDGFWNQLGQRLGGHFLPLIEDASQLKILIGKIFYLESDSIWLNNVDDKDWATLFGLIGQSNSNVDEKHAIQREMIKAITVLSYRISGIGLYPEFINAQPELTEYESPFLVQNREIIEFIEKYKKQDISQHDTVVTVPPDASQAFVMLEQCRDVVLKIRRATKRIGVSLSLTYLLSLLEQCLDRIELLLYLVVDDSEGRYVF